MVCFIGMARINFEYDFFMTSIKRFSKLVLGSGSRMSQARNSNGSLAGKSMSFYSLSLSCPVHLCMIDSFLRH